jgi:ribosomal protein L37E
MGKNKHGLCRRCGQERALYENGAHCRACGRADRAEKQKTIPKRQAPEPALRVLWPPEQESWGRCPKCETGVQLLVDGMTTNHKSGKSEAWDGIGRRCTGSGRRPTELVEPPHRRVEVLDQPDRVRDHEFLDPKEIPAGLPGQGRNRRH